MYWYLSFLRPPPVSVVEGSDSIVITPQVANDLRTEVRYEPTDVYYQWQKVDRKSSSSASPVQHLTTFIPPESTYKSLSIPLPRVRAGEKWRLCLRPDKAPDRQALKDVLGESSKVPVVAVWSEPIVVTAPVQEKREVKKPKLEPKANKGKGKEKKRDDGPKQTRIQREWSFVTDTGEPTKTLRVVEQTSYDLDKKIWDSGLALSAWFSERLDREPKGRPVKLLEKEIFAILQRKEPDELTRVLELGSGTGLVSIALRSCLAIPASSRFEITATDLGSAMELMNENIALNLSETNEATPRLARGQDAHDQDGRSDVHLRARTLDWDDSLPSWVTSTLPDLIIAADVTYNTSSFLSLVKTLRDLMKPASGKRPPLLLAYKQREEAERELWDMLKKESIELELVDTIAGAEEDGRVEIWAGVASNA